MAITLNGSSGIQFPNFIENEQSIDADYTIAATKNAASIGDIEIRYLILLVTILLLEKYFKLSTHNMIHVALNLFRLQLLLR